MVDESLAENGIILGQGDIEAGIEHCGAVIFEHAKKELNVDLTNEQYAEFKFECYMPTMLAFYQTLPEVFRADCKKSSISSNSVKKAPGCLLPILVLLTLLISVIVIVTL